MRTVPNPLCIDLCKLSFAELTIAVCSIAFAHSQTPSVMYFKLNKLKQLLWFWIYITGISSRLCSHTKAYYSLGMTMTSSELLPSVMSTTLLQETGVTLSALRATFSATHPNASKAMTNRGHGRGVLIWALYSHSCRFFDWALYDKKRQLLY